MRLSTHTPHLHVSVWTSCPPLQVLDHQRRLRFQKVCPMRVPFPTRCSEHNLQCLDDRFVMAFVLDANLNQDLAHMAPSRVLQEPSLHNARNWNAVLKRLQNCAFLELHGILLEPLVSSTENFPGLVDCLCATMMKARFVL